MLVAQGKLDEALTACRDGLAIAERLAAADRSNTEWQRDLSVSYERVGNVLVAQGKLDEALKAYRDGLAIRERLAAADRSNTQWQRDLSGAFKKVGDVLVAQGKLDEALKSYRDGLAIAERLAKADQTNAQWQFDLVTSHWRTCAGGRRAGCALDRHHRAASQAERPRPVTPKRHRFWH